MTSLLNQPSGLFADPREAWLANLLDPSVGNRSAILPLVEVGGDDTGRGSVEFGAPQFLVDMLKSAMLPGAAAQGYQPAPEEVTQMAMDTMLGGGLLGRAPSGALGMNLWHGGPHKWAPEPDFPHGRPRLDKMGTGEGAQAYGHGFYSAASPKVAKTYQSKVSAMQGGAKPTIDGIPIDWDDPVQTAAFELARHNGDRAAAADFHAKTFKSGEDNAAVKILRSNQKLPNVSFPGSLYKLDIPDADVAKYLDWDAPVSEQPEGVRKIINGMSGGLRPFRWQTLKNLRRQGLDALGQVSDADDFVNMFEDGAQQARAALDGPRWEFEQGISNMEMALSELGIETPLRNRLRALRTGSGKLETPDGMTGNEFYKHLAIATGSDEAASAALRKAGIPGLKYFDGSSRGKGEGTRNYVTWDQEVLDRSKILERDGESLVANSMASKGVNLYNIKPREARPFEADYPKGAPTNAEGLLTTTIDGDPINVGGRVVGRVESGLDQAFPATQSSYDAIAKEGTGRPAALVARSDLGRGTHGATRVDPETKRPLGVALSRDLNPAQLQSVYAHEIGHVIDQLAGEITPSGISKELKALYNWANNPNRNAQGEPYQKTKSGNLKLWTPEHAGYKKSDVEREYIAEAIRAYMSDPNAMKTDYPKTAAFLRKKINNDPNVRDIIQFNMGGGLPLGLFGSSEEDI